MLVEIFMKLGPSAPNNLPDMMDRNSKITFLKSIDLTSI